MGVFTDYIKNHAKGHATGLIAGVRSHVSESRADYNRLHGTMPSAREYVQSDAGRASARHAVGTGISKWLQHSTNRNFRKGNYVMGALMTFAGHALSSHMDNLKRDQRVFENVAKVRRGDPDVRQMTHNELREVRDHAQRYGGHDHESILKAALGELDRRQTNKGTEKAQAKIVHDSAVHAHKQTLKTQGHEDAEARKEAAHANKLRRLREISGHTREGKIADAQHMLKIRQGLEKTKTAGVKARQGAIQKTVAAKARLVKKTDKGAYFAKEGGGTYYQSNEKIQAIGKKPRGGAGRKRSI